VRIELPHDFAPREYQARFMAAVGEGGLKRAVWVVHRRAGKDLTALHAMCQQALIRKGLYWHMLPSYRQARKAVWNGIRGDGKRIIDNVFPEAIRKRTNEVEMLIELVNGSIIQLVGSDNYDSLVGSNPVGVTYSEFALNRPAAWDYIRPILAENGGWAWFVSTPRGRNHLHNLYEHARTDPTWFCERLSIHDTQALPEAVLEEERRAGMPEAMIRSEYLCDFDAAMVGSVWGDLLSTIEERGGVAEFQHSHDEVFTSWDLGISDSTAIWFWRIGEDGAIEVVDYYESHGKPLSHYCDEVESRGYGYKKHWLPHDARARTLQTGASILEQMVRRFGTGAIGITPEVSLLDGIQAARWMMQRPIRIHSRCNEGIDCIRQYHYEWDEDRKVFSGRPEHDFSSHGADAWRYIACVVRNSENLVRKEPVKVPKFVPRVYTMDDLIAENSTPQRRRI
jgi:phage terminase large subunit